MRTLSKSKLLAYRQCPKRLWLEVHHPELRADSAAAQASFAIGHDVGSLARKLYDPEHRGVLIDVATEGFLGALEHTQRLLATSEAPIFEAGFTAAGTIAFADILLPDATETVRGWRMVEIKAAGSVKPYHRDDAAIQHYVASRSGLPLTRVAIGHIDTGWVYPGDERYQGIFVEADVTDDARSRHDEVHAWVSDARRILASEICPNRGVGVHCFAPFECGFVNHCSEPRPNVAHPVTWLPRVQAAELKDFLARPEIQSLGQVPDELLNGRQRRVKEHTLAGTVYHDAMATAAALAQAPLPALFLDFETIAFAVPIWAGTRPYEQVPFQYSLHRQAEDGTLTQRAFLDLSGADPSRKIAEDLVHECRGDAPIFAYNVAFERRCLTYLAGRFDDLSPSLFEIAARLFDLLPIVRDHYYHPAQQGSWSLKAVLPTLVPDLSYAALDGVRDGGAAQDAYAEAIHSETTPERKTEIEQQLLAYCALDTLAMVRLREKLVAVSDPHQFREQSTGRLQQSLKCPRYFAALRLNLPVPDVVSGLPLRGHG